MKADRLGGFLRRDIRSMAGACARTTLLAALSLTVTPLLGTSLSEGDRPAFVEEAQAALIADAARTEARELWENRAPAQMAERGGRVFDARSAALKAFAVGRVGERGGLLQAGLVSGDELMRTALAGPRAIAENMTRAASLQPGTGLSAAGGVLTAALRNDTAPSLSDAAGSPVDEMAYAPSSGPSVSSRFDDILRDRDDRGFVPPLGEKDHAWAATPLPASVFSKKEQTCLATGIYFEARGEVARGQEAVAQVILNRVRAPSYPDSICGVVYQNQHMRNRCQFSFACDGIPDRITNKRAYAKAERVALAVTQGDIWLPEVGSATHYHATYVRPRWARAMEQVDKIGLHIFYRTFGGGWN